MFFKNFHGTLLINSMETIDSNPTKIRTAFKIYSMSGCSTKSYIQLNLNQEYVICKEKSYLFIKLKKKKKKRESYWAYKSYTSLFFFLGTEANVKQSTNWKRLFLFNLINILRQFESISLLWSREDINNLRDVHVIRSPGTDNLAPV